MSKTSRSFFKTAI